MASAVKVLVVDDSALVRQLVTRALEGLTDIQVVGVAKTAVEALERIPELEPDVITLDIEMPDLTGLEALPHLVKASPARIVMLSALDDPDTTYQALGNGATDFVVKPKTGMASSIAELRTDLVRAIRTAFAVHPDHRVRSAARPAVRRVVEGPAVGQRRDIRRIVAFAASTGGPPALEEVFAGLDSRVAAAYLVVQHLPSGFADSLARRLARVSGVDVVEATDLARIEPGRAYVAPHGTHMKVEGGIEPRVLLTDGPPVHGVRPAADVLLSSVAHEFGDRSMGVVLSGMGADGSRGLADIANAGGETIVQDEETSVIWGMPGTAQKLAPGSRALPVNRIAAEIRHAARG